MASELGYEIVESGTNGKVAVATRDFLPGDTVLQEKEPVLFLSKEVLQEFRQYDPAGTTYIFLAAFVVVMKRSHPDVKAKLLTLYGPTTGASADSVRAFAKKIHFSPNNDTDPRSMTAEEVETFVKIANIVRLNMFEWEGGKLVFSEITRFSHSCSANCVYFLRDKGIVCRTLRNITVGEELTISYMPDRDMEPTHVRRHKFLEAKEFTCHCARCDAPGDDTRQFDCVDSACKGVMMACQPINKEVVRITNLPYTGVEYEEPHLLPCTMCHRAAPAAYQAKMFVLEARLPALVQDFVKRQVDMVSRADMGSDRYDRLLKEIQSHKLPTRHGMVVPIHNVIVKIHRFKLMNIDLGFQRGDAVKTRATVQRAVRDYIAAQEGITPGVNPNVCNVYFQACSDCIIEWQDPRIGCPPIFPPPLAKLMLQRLLRMKLILRARNESRDETVDSALLTVLEKLPPSESTELCAFCEESPLRAAIRRTRCCTCSQVAYCSAGCQKAHWKLHKKTCKEEKA